MTGNEIVKKVAKLRSIAYPELKSVATLDFDDYDKIIDTLAAEIFGSIEDAWDALDKVNTNYLLYFYLDARGYDVTSMNEVTMIDTIFRDRINTIDYTIVAKDCFVEACIGIDCRNNDFTYLSIYPECYRIHSHGPHPVELLSTIADTYHLPADLNLETADISFSLSAVTNIFYYLQWTNNITISKRNSYIKQAQLYNALNTMR